jgi:Cu(I)/Ag(I) efflux system protein CusF
MEMMKGMKEMDMKQCMGMMKGMDSKEQGTSQTGPVHQATGVVKAVDPAKGTVTLAHEPVPSLKWPNMTMSFGVNDKSLFDKLALGKKVAVEFVQQGSNYIVTAVK